MRRIRQSYKFRGDPWRRIEMISSILSWLLFVFSEELNRMLTAVKVPKGEETRVYK